ncbi:hypothetical protein, partial [Pseudomonas fragi]|uniref:hypothetical protein n=1 Tax=Pseudomonas fragi TaxID=296 RepID=UPI001CB74A6B
SQRLSLKEHHHNGDALLGTQVVVLGRHGNTLHEVLHLLLETAHPLARRYHFSSFAKQKCEVVTKGLMNASYRFAHCPYL